ncbi:DNA-binding protein H-NS [Burkholderia sp. D7]|nr:DNA-binding protein H-NS [Burkholderia sp. D7]
MDYRDLLAKAAELDRQIASAREVEAAGALAEIKARVAEFGFTVEDVFSTKKARKERKRSGPTYRDPESGATWSGMGREPGWIKGKNRAAFVVGDEYSASENRESPIEQLESLGLPATFPAALMPEAGSRFVSDCVKGMDKVALMKLARDRGFMPSWSRLAHLGAGVYELGLTIDRCSVPLLVRMKVVEPA